jgi:hypothetical protein
MRSKIRIVFLIILVYVVFLGHGFTQEVCYGNFAQLISQIKAAMPDENSYGFVVPSLAQMDTFRAVTRLLLNEEYYLADSLAGMIGYTVLEWYDTAYDSNRYYVLMEPSANISGGVELGWGTFVFDPQGAHQVIIEVPHPLFDTNTWRVGFTSYQVGGSAYFLMAGTHRYANGTDPRPADVAHNTQNMFHVVHQEVSPLCSHALQVHGFSVSGHPGYPNVVLSNGTPSPDAILDSLAQEIMAEGYTVGIFDGIHYSDLGATTNTQGQFSNSHGYSFIHMELEYFIRANASHWEKFVDILYRTFHVPVEIQNDKNDIVPEQVILSPAYPNPFNSSVHIQFYTPESIVYSLAIYNILGQLIRNLNHGITPAGWFEANWNSLDDHGNPVASGSYLVILRTENIVKVQKIILIK